MNKKIIFFLALFTTFFCFSQDTILKSKNSFTISKTYMDIKSYKKTYKRDLTKLDTLNFKFKENDTLVLLTQKDEQKFTTVPFEYKDEKSGAIRQRALMTASEMYCSVAKSPNTSEFNVLSFSISRTGMP